MGNEPEENNLKDINFNKSSTIMFERTITRNDRTEKEKREFNRFKNYMLKFEYYKKLLKLGCRKNPVLKLLYEPESSFNDYNQQMFYILENIPYINYYDCMQLLEIKHPIVNNEKKLKEENNSHKDNMNLENNNNENDKNQKKEAENNKSSFKNQNQLNIKKNITFDVTKTEHFNKDTNKNKLTKEDEKEVKTFNDGVLEMMESIVLYDEKKIQKILLIYPINNMRWFIWLSMAKVKYREINEKINISNKEIYDDLVGNIDLNDDSLMFDLHNTLKELKVYKYNWSNSFYRIIKCITAFEHNMRYENGMNILIGVPLLISDCNEEETFFFGRYLLSISYGLGLYYFYDENELLLNYLVFIFHYLAKEKYPKIYERLSEFNISDELWIKKWIKTFFSSIFDLSITIRVWDCVIAVGIKFLVNYSLAILEYFEDKIMNIKKVKEFLEFFDYELRDKYKKDKEILFFRENILNLAQSYYIPNGKYQLIEKEYLKILFAENDTISGKSYQFDTSKTINNYYTNNDYLDDEQYHVKLILRTIIYTPNELKINNVEEENISIYQKKKLKQTKRKSLTVIKENEQIDKNTLKNKENDSKKSKEKKGSNEIEATKLFSSLGEIPNNREHTEPNLIDIGKLLISKESEDRINEKKKENKKENKINDNNVKELIDNKENKKDEKLSEKVKDINTIEDNSKDKTKENMSDNSSNDDYEDITFDFTFNEEQVPTT